jgi:hypothetical protein
VASSVVGGVDPKHLIQVAPAEHEHPVQALRPDRTDPPLGERVRSRCQDRGLTILTPSQRTPRRTAPRVSSLGLGSGTGSL